MNEHDKNFLRETNMALVRDHEFEDILLWAHRRHYIVLSSTPTGQMCFSNSDLEQAKMWAEKEGLYEGDGNNEGVQE